MAQTSADRADCTCNFQSQQVMIMAVNVLRRGCARQWNVAYLRFFAD